MGSFIADFDSSLPLFLHAAWLTISVTIVSLVFAVIVGAVFSAFSMSRIKPLVWLYQVYIWLIRGTPLILQIAFLYFPVEQVFHVNLSVFWAGGIALAAHNGAYLAEIFRGAIQSIDKGQREAASAVGMNRYLMMRRVVIPQAIRRAVPPTINQFIIGLKDSSLLGLFGLTELYGLSMQEYSRTYHALEWLSIGGIYYLVMTFIFTVLGNQVERRLDVSRRKRPRRGLAEADGGVTT